MEVMEVLRPPPRIEKKSLKERSYERSAGDVFFL